MKGRPLSLILAEGVALIVLLFVLGTIGVSIGAAVNDGLKSSLTKKPKDAAPAWSPDGSLIAFVRTDEDSGALFVMDSDGAEQIRIADAAPHSGVTWVGKRIAFLRSGRAFAASADGSSVRRLRSGPVDTLSHPSGESLSPDGAELAFARDGHIYVGDENGDDAVQLTGT